MTEHDSLFSLLRQANPVPDPEALLETTVSSDLETRSERNQTVSTTTTNIDFEKRTAPPRRRSPLAIAAAALVIVAGVLLVLRPSPEIAAPSEVSATFFQAINANDVDAWWALHSDDALIFGESITDETVRQGYQDYFDWRTTVESRFEDVTCAETGNLDSATGGAAVRCGYVWRGAVQDRIGVAFNGYMLMAVDQDKIVNLIIDSPDFSSMGDIPIRYLSEHHPAEFEALCGGGPGAFNGGAECARLYMDNLDGIAELWESENG